MTASVQFEIDEELRDLASSAAQWLAGFYSGIRVELHSDAILLSAGHLDRDTLTTIWTAALANERLLARARIRRAAAFETLAR